MPVRKLGVGQLPEFAVGFFQQGLRCCLSSAQQFVSLRLCLRKYLIDLAAVDEVFAGNKCLVQSRGPGPQFKGAS
ncbi:hypothetical protein AA303_05755 [Pseudomonas psychrophila]|nr:hypothetical protein AA303_05755 [Pseudomonas psychrophila]